MKCYICDKTPVKDNVPLFPVDKKGTESRRWACMEHVALETIPNDVKKICKIFDERIKE